MRRHSKGGGGCAFAASAQPPTWTTYQQHQVRRLSQTTPLTLITASGEQSSAT
jgi:hypothetical protein